MDTLKTNTTLLFIEESRLYDTRGSGLEIAIAKGMVRLLNGLIESKYENDCISFNVN